MVLYVFLYVLSSVIGVFFVLPFVSSDFVYITDSEVTVLLYVDPIVLQ